MAMKPKKKKNNQKPKLNVTVHEAQRNKLEQMASIEKRSVSDLIEVLDDERWERLVGQQGIAYARTVAEAMNLKLLAMRRPGAQSLWPSVRADS
jgi:uncharacterized protein (DUF1778 family)